MINYSQYCYYHTSTAGAPHMHVRIVALAHSDSFHSPACMYSTLRSRRVCFSYEPLIPVVFCLTVTESLQYPDFTCVALYKKLVVGFAFLVPDAGYNESYISFLFVRPEWRRAGIASFMLYHLIQVIRLGMEIIAPVQEN